MTTPLIVTDFGQSLSGIWGAVVSFVPRLLVFLVVLVLGWLIAKFVGRMVAKGLAKVGLDRALERSGIGEYFQRSRYSAGDIAGKFVYYAGVLIVLQLAFSAFGPNNPITRMLNGVVAWLPQLAIALVIVVVAAMIARAVRDLIAGALGGLGYGRMLAGIAGVFILALGVIAALNQIGVATAVTQPVLITVLATIAGIMIVGVGGGLIRPMQQRWSGWLDTAEQETRRIRQEGSYQRGRTDAMSGARTDERTGPTHAATGQTQQMSTPRQGAHGYRNPPARG
ncbi:mechanosensitive ion channel family protein [Actinorugispora endophytica]|uniref:Putative transporter (Transmembrane protein) n=1 Tax=Actinorugispora endophytica TaxID=1605990 RepID=A0A4R6V3I7_9ACTN|nr:hypothetical protein [Actinorugispora endophytica]TDQ54733.1 putative transporter (transmembrane protein) [Actinorugispora endophytica]